MPGNIVFVLVLAIPLVLVVVLALVVALVVFLPVPAWSPDQARCRAHERLDGGYRGGEDDDWLYDNLAKVLNPPQADFASRTTTRARTRMRTRERTGTITCAA